jgi:hypothetical protein
MIRLLFLSAAPTTTTRVRLEQEVREIALRIAASPYRDQIQLVSEWSARPGDLQQALLRTRPHIVHFYGHGTGDAIVLEDEEGRPLRLDAQALAETFRLIGHDTRLVVLNGCYSMPLAEALAGAVGVVLGVPSSVDPVAAQAFMGAFYQALSYGMSIQVAFDLALNNLDLNALSWRWEERPGLVSDKRTVHPETVTFVAETGPASSRMPRSIRLAEPGGMAIATSGYLAQQFFQDAGFHLGSADEPDRFLCFPRIAQWQMAIPSGAYARIVMHRPLDGQTVLEIRESAQRTTPRHDVAFVVVDTPVDDATWMQIAALRATRFNVVPVPHSLIQEAMTKGRREAAEALLSKHLERFLGKGTDPYNVRNPVFDVLNFFGREALADEIVYLLSSGQPVGLFGLRKMGKTSLLGYLRGRIPYPVALLDLQTGTALPHLYDRLLLAWNDDARTRHGVDLGLGDARVGAADPSGDFVALATDTLTKLALKGLDARLAILLDEIELLVPPEGGPVEAIERTLSFTRALRGLIQEGQRLSILVAGVDPSINRISRWRATGEQNPLFSFLQEICVPPLRGADVIQMARNIGRQVELWYGDAAAARIAAASGGHPYLARQLLSLAYARRERQPGEVTPAELSAAEDLFLYDARYAATINDTGLWGELTGGPLWSPEMARANEAILRALALAGGPVAAAALVEGGPPGLRRRALAALEQFGVVRRATAEGDRREIACGLFQAWIRLGTEE